MKKTLIALSGILFVAFFVIFVANAQNKDQEVKKKACTEVSKDCGKCPSASGCAKMANAAEAPCAKKCDPAKCKEMGCDQAKCKETGCDPAKCKANCKEATAEVKCCPQAKCKMMTEK
jgi:hypothetical protein